MTPYILEASPRTLIAMQHRMSLVANTTAQLWQSFRMRRSEIEHVIGTDLYSVRSYEEDYFRAFRPDRVFSKWAAIEVEKVDSIPEGMELLHLPGGLYAVFHYVGNPTAGTAFFTAMYSQWIPQAGLEIDTRPHFEILGSQYKNNADDSEEDIWVPIRAQ